MNHYRRIRELGSGGTARVYLAVDTASGTRYALKQYESSEAFNRARGELTCLDGLSHPGLPRFYEARENERGGFLVMEYVPGTVLRDIVRREGALTEKRVVRIGLEICDLFAYLQRQRNVLIYRDLKPGNLMISPSSHVKLIDFGSALIGSEGRAEVFEPVGTRGFAAPEQFIRRGVIDSRVDIYGFGATMYQLLTGNSPTQLSGSDTGRFAGEGKISAKMKKVLERCLQSDPACRYSYFEEIRRDLVTLETGRKCVSGFRVTRSEKHI